MSKIGLKVLVVGYMYDLVGFFVAHSIFIFAVGLTASLKP